ncbi:ubiquitin carboxyl-terminal hydrolase 36 [Ceratitis capitata]|uniref:ubiquitin carboxyl-terminal hydrolase 36 n=1 Tax=Ceratitis capitata TaxID=7213 RepID=UPI000C6C6AE8|nr:ubiquitin carboxyl-terminal hydrolase 36 [Ceratitis capitata]
MNFIFGARIFLLSISLLDGLAGLRLVKVSIPTYRFRGESAMLECQYELNRTGGPPYYGGVGSSSGSSNNGNSGRDAPIAGATNRQRSQSRTRTQMRNAHTRNRYASSNMKIFDAHHLMEMRPKYKRRNKRQYSYQTERLQLQQQQQQQQQQQTHQQHYQQHYIQTYPHPPSQQSYGDSSNSGSIISSSSSSSSSSGSGDITAAGSSYYQQQYQQQQQQKQEEDEDEPYQYPYQTQRSPYGHSVYRGAAFSQALGIPGFSSSGISSSSSSNSRGAQVGASTFTHRGSTNGAAAEASSRRYSFADNTDDDEENADGDDEDEEEEEEEEDEEGEALYAIKWYKDNEEFYRFVPKGRPQKTSYRFDGIRVSEEHSDSWRVLLRGLTINSSGLYSCEISAEAPNFSSVKGEGRMDVVFLPRDGPHIRGQQNQYQIGDTLSLNCTSGKSHPASKLQWLINDQLNGGAKILCTCSQNRRDNGNFSFQRNNSSDQKSTST